jgi:toxin YhaV
MVCNGWDIRYHQIFNKRLENLINSVESARKKDPTGYKSHPHTKLLARIHNLITSEIPKNPSSPCYHLGTYLGKYTAWKRAKDGLGRYRLFFRYSSGQKTIIHAWLNDENTLRKAGDKTDVYNVFKGMLNNGTVADDFEALQQQSLSS